MKNIGIMIGYLLNKRQLNLGEKNGLVRVLQLDNNIILSLQKNNALGSDFLGMRLIL